MLTWTAFMTFAKARTWKDWLMFAALGVILVLMATCTADKIGDHFSKDKVTRANNEDREIREDLSTKREETNTSITETERKLNEELAKLPDAMPSPRRLSRACGELRDRGYVPLPPECGSGAN